MAERTITVGRETLVIDDTDVDVGFVDMFTEAFYNRGMVYMSFASVIADSGNQKIAKVQSRIRMSARTAISLRDMLNRIFEDAQRQRAENAADKS